jgi:hypothetical protein
MGQDIQLGSHSDEKTLPTPVITNGIGGTACWGNDHFGDRFCDFAITDEAASAEIYGFIRPEYWKDARKAEKPIGTY